MLETIKRTAFRNTIRFGIRPVLSSGISYNAQRNFALAVTSICVAPRGMRHEPINLGGVAGERVSVDGHSGERLLIWLHGGGYCVGSSRTDRAAAGQFARAGKVQVIVPDYRLAPEHPHPAALEDAVAVYKALLEDGVPAASIALGGDSAGGGLALATAVALRDQGLPLPASLSLSSPWVDLRLAQASYHTRAKRDPWLTKGLLMRWASAYLGGRPASDPACSPLLADLHGLPPTLIQVGELEMLRDEAHMLARKLGGQGVDVRLHEFENMWHVFFLQAGLLQVADEAVAEMGDFIQDNWGRPVKLEKSA